MVPQENLELEHPARLDIPANLESQVVQEEMASQEPLAHLA